MKIDFEKMNGLVPAIIQDGASSQVLMLGYMNKEAFKKTRDLGKVVFYSRSKKRLWTKGETSGNYLMVKEILPDCDNDAILIQVEPKGHTCHKGNNSCFDNDSSKGFLYKLQRTISQRIDDNEENSYTNEIFKKGINKVAQKVGEEAVELIIEAKDHNEKLFKNEAADLFYHFLVLLKAKGFQMGDIERILQERR